MTIYVKKFSSLNRALGTNAIGTVWERFTARFKTEAP